MNNYHKTVLLQEAVEYLRVQERKKYIDATLGGGGHTREIIKRGGIVLGIDYDMDSLDYVKKTLNKELGHRIYTTQGNFKDIDKIARSSGFEQVAGIIFDLGLSSYQLDAKDRGFSFQNDAPLDMRMDKNLSVTAADLVNGLTKGELYELFTKLGEENFARIICNNIISARESKRIETTAELAKIAERSYPKGYKKIHPATKIFQALRIAVNDELNNLKESLPKALQLLEANGRLIIISFHSLEDRIVKNFFIDAQENNLGKIITEKPVIPNDEEIEINNKARSAKMRVFEVI